MQLKIKRREDYLDNIWNNARELNICESERDKRRARNGRITFDCFNTHSHLDRAYCTKGIPLNPQSNDGTMMLFSVLRGWCSGMCKDCKDYSDEVTKAGGGEA